MTSSKSQASELYLFMLQSPVICLTAEQFFLANLCFCNKAQTHHVKTAEILLLPMAKYLVLQKQIGHFRFIIWFVVRFWLQFPATSVSNWFFLKKWRVPVNVQSILIFAEIQECSVIIYGSLLLLHLRHCADTSEGYISPVVLWFLIPLLTQHDHKPFSGDASLWPVFSHRGVTICSCFQAYNP